MSDEQVRTTGGGPATEGETAPVAPGTTSPEATVVVPTGPTGSVEPTGPPATPPRSAGHRAASNRTRVSGMWVGLILSAVVLLFLLIFILQNLDPVQIHFLGADGTLPTGVALLLAAIAGVLLVAIPGSARIVQLRRAARKGRRAL
ncbi:lipopolysaccharide assembly protein LapA domain-containing protein [Pseudonocardia sp. RS11V-5]|uniref:LapA family protein n=1 Tax=Pseudonocardia terrae TaxID=2905831 RepID=UPI001E3B870A|nr:lipopolysaccharide assembly protein LapA domain-containing protein [Pseudonocardia terrae]MCE3555109.1 lipopolysaccharide assembly protein LapA domain-containing protein [Pseudonocardia terrae]